MLELKEITKVYPAGEGKVEALKGVSLRFRKSEFVSILGPSGCGKTTLLNIIGGLDQYTEGDLVINGRSTKKYKDRDWDAYRNHSVGFVFQSYNLIPHQTVLKNVELALTLSGVSKAERKRRAKEALEQVGLGDQLHKRPNQMSGGQMQRVAIARAIVNNPDIILADEPTGALDTQTSLQVMEILRGIAKDRLVIMVTHNPDLAEQYSSRIVRILDGVLLSDSAPMSDTEVMVENALAAAERTPFRKAKKPSMSLFTSFGLSLRNLISKKGRTVLTSFAGSIGIIGIALIYAVSQGTTNYINVLQEDTLASYPITIEAETMDVGSLMLNFMGSAESAGSHELDGVYQKTMIYDMITALNNTESTENDLVSFKKHVEEELRDEESALSQALSGVQYGYDLNMLVYTKNVDGSIIRSDSQELMQELLLEYFGMDISGMLNMESMGMSMEDMASSPLASASPMASSINLWNEMLPAKDGGLINPLLEKQYDVIYGEWPSAYNEIVLVVDERNELDDMTLYALGLKSKEDIDALADASINGAELEATNDKWSFQEICDMDFRVIFNSDCYTKDEITGVYTDLRSTEAGLKYLYDNGLDLKVSGIIRPSEEATSAMLTGAIGYTHALTEHIMEKSRDSAAVQAQLEDPETDIFTGLPFRENTGNLSDAEKEDAFRAYVEKLNPAFKPDTYVKIMSIPSDAELEQMVAQGMAGQTPDSMTATLRQVIVAQTGMSEDEIEGYLEDMAAEEIEELFEAMVTEQAKLQYATSVQQQLASVPAAQRAAMLDEAMKDFTQQECARFYDEVLEFSDSSYEDNLLALGYLDPESPSAVNLYAASFESKDTIEAAIEEYNAGRDELSQIKYTDYIGLMMSSVTSIINAITYVLIAFVAVSLVVSSIMIGVITLISVQERTKEIGILRAIGASRKNVSNMFNAETVIIGFTSGALGVLVTVLLCIPINAILQHFTGLSNLRAVLPWQVGALLIAISMVLTLISGLIPARSAAKKDPVVALRTE